MFVGGYPSGQRGQTVNLLTYVYEGSNPSLPTINVKILLKIVIASLFFLVRQDLSVIFFLLTTNYIINIQRKRVVNLSLSFCMSRA